jgi:hypothetical protein
MPNDTMQCTRTASARNDAVIRFYDDAGNVIREGANSVNFESNSHKQMVKLVGARELAVSP